MKKILFILSALLLTGGGLSAQSTPAQKESKEKFKQKKFEWNLGENPFLVKDNASKDYYYYSYSDDERLTVTPAGDMTFTLTGCDASKTRPLVVKNNSDETIDGLLYFSGGYYYGLEPDVELGDPVFGENSADFNNMYLVSYFEVGGYAYAVNSYMYSVVRTNLATGEQITAMGTSGYASLAYDGQTFWASGGNDNYIYALDADLNPTGKKINVGYPSILTWTGTELLACERYNPYKSDVSGSRMKTYDVDGNLTADYGVTSVPVYTNATYEPGTGIVWASTRGSLIGFSLQNGKVTLEAGSYYYGIIAGFDNDGLPYITDYDNYTLYKAEKFSTMPKGLNLSQSAINLGAGQQVTVNITVDAQVGSREIGLYCYGMSGMLFARKMVIEVDAEPEFEATTGLQFSAFADYPAATQTAWIKNTGCSPIIFDEIPTIGTEYFEISGLIPSNFEGYLSAGDSVGAVISFFAETAGKYKDTMTIVTENAGTIKIPFAATASELSYTVPESVDAAIDCDANTASANATIANNSNAAMTIYNRGNVVLDVYTVRYASEISVRLLDANGNVLYEVPQYTYSNNTHYQIEQKLPMGKYTLLLGDSNADTWDGGGYMNVSVDGQMILNHIESVRGLYTTEYTFEVKPSSNIKVAAGQTINKLSFPIAGLALDEPVELLVSFDGLSEAIDTITVNLTPGEPELMVADTFDLGQQLFSNSEEFYYYYYYFLQPHTFTIANTGCGPLYIDKIEVNNPRFALYDENAQYSFASFVGSLEDIEIDARGTYELKLYIYPDSAGLFADNLSVIVGDDTTNVVLTATGVKMPRLEYEGEGLGFVNDTVDCNANSATIKGRIANSGEGDLIVNEPIKIQYQAGNVNAGAFSVTNTELGLSSNYNYTYFEDGDFAYFMPATEGEYTVEVWNNGPNDGKLVITSGDKTVLALDLATTYSNGIRTFTLTANDIVRDTVAPGDTIDIEMTVELANASESTLPGPLLPYPISDDSRTFTYQLTSNDPYADYYYPYITMQGKVVIVDAAPQLVLPDSVNFGEVSAGFAERKDYEIENNSCGGYDVDNIWVVNDESPLYVDEEGIWFEPTTEGTFYNTLKLAISYDSVGTEVKDTFDIVLSGVCVASPIAEYNDDPIEIVAEKGATSVKVTSAAISNVGTATALKLTESSSIRVIAFTGTSGSSSTRILSLSRVNGNGSMTMIREWSPSSFANNNMWKEFYVDHLPAGNYALGLYDGGNYNWNNGYAYVLSGDGTTVLLSETRKQNYGSSTAYGYFTIEEKEPISVAAGDSVKIEWEIPIKGMEAGEHYFERDFSTNDANMQTIYFVVKVTINEDYAYDYNKDSIEFTPVHTKTPAYSSVTLRNRGTIAINMTDNWFKSEEEDDAEQLFEIYRVSGNANIEDSLTISVKFKGSEVAGIFRDTLYVEHDYNDSVFLDTIPLVATVNNTQVIAVSTPNSRYAVAGDTIDINVSFDSPVIIVTDTTFKESLPKLAMNTNGFALLDTTTVTPFREDFYTITFRYAVLQADNVDLFDYTEDSIYMMGCQLIDWEGMEFNEVKLPAVGTLSSNFPVTIDNILPIYVAAVSDTVTTDSAVTLTVLFSEAVKGFGEDVIALSNGAKINNFFASDATTYVAELVLPHAAVTNISINAEVADLAGNAIKIAWSSNVATVHDFDTTVVEPTFDNVGYKKLVCKICGETIYIDTVPAVKLESIALTSLPAKLNYNLGEVIDLTGAQLTLTFNNGTTRVIDLTMAMISGFDVTASGKQTITVTYVENGETFTTTFDIEIANISAVSEIAAAEVSIYAFENTIVVEAEADGSEIAVFDVNGRMVAKATATSSRTEIEMSEAGVYVVRIGNTAQSVAIK